MSIEVTRFDTAAALRHAAESFLMRHETEHNLLLGLIGRLERTPHFYGSQPYFALAISGSDAVAAAVMTPPFPVVLSLCDDDEALTPLAENVHAYLPETSGVTSAGSAARRFADAWHELTGEAYEVALSEHLYRLERLRPPSGVSGKARVAGEADLGLVASWHIAFAEEATPWEVQSRDESERNVRLLLQQPQNVGGVLLWQDEGRPVSMAAYGNPTRNSMRIGGVYTPPEHRRRGYAGACTAAAAQAVLDSGKSFVTLFTDLSNPTSNHIYQALGFEPVCDAEMLRFAGR